MRIPLIAFQNSKKNPNEMALMIQLKYQMKHCKIVWRILLWYFPACSQNELKMFKRVKVHNNEIQQNKNQSRIKQCKVYKK